MNRDLSDLIVPSTQRTSWLRWGFFVVFIALSTAYACGGAKSVTPASEKLSGDAAEVDIDAADKVPGLGKDAGDEAFNSADAGTEPPNTPPDQVPTTPTPILPNGVLYPTAQGAKAPAALLPGAQARACPVGAAKGAFTGQPCAETALSSACVAKGCTPAGLPTSASNAPKEFFADCDKESVYCVGSVYEFKTIQAAADAVAKNNPPATIKIANGLYSESVSFSNFKGKLTIIGASNDRLTGARIVAPVKKAEATYAALSFKGVDEVVVERLLIAGAGHGIFAEDFVSVVINNDHLVANTRTGISLRNTAKGTASITNNIIQYNGAQFNVLGPDTVSVVINNDHRTGTNVLGVVINNDHRATGYAKVASSYTLKQLRFGVASEGVKEVTVSQNTIRNNGAGGIRISPGAIAVVINNDHRVAFGEKIAVVINNDHRVTMKGNRIAHNGPMGRTNYTQGQSNNRACSQGLFREGGVCFPTLLAPRDDRAALGVGAVVAGMETVKLSDNSFYGNDSIGLLVHSTTNAVVTGNAFSRNGIRPHARYESVKEGDAPGGAFWNVRGALELSGNLVLDQLTDGLLVRHGRSATGTLELKVEDNHFAGIGRYLPGGQKSLGTGFHIDASAGTVAMTNVARNFFHRNRRAGMFTKGRITGNIKDNFFLQQVRRALALTDMGADAKDNNINITGNVIDGATGYGIQLYTGSANVTVSDNMITGIARLDGRTDDPLMEGDALNIGEMSGPAVKISGNTFAHSLRCGCFFSKSDVDVSGGNKYESCSNNLMEKTTAGKTSNADASRANPEMHNRKNLDE